jgi:hypothetical protein
MSIEQNVQTVKDFLAAIGRGELKTWLPIGSTNWLRRKSWQFLRPSK